MEQDSLWEPPPPIEGTFDCTFCRYTAPTFADVMRHMQVHTERQQPLEGSEWPMTFFPNDHATEHIMGIHKVHSPMASLPLFQPKKHIVRQHTNEEPFKASKCPVEVSRKDHVLTPILHESTTEMPFKRSESPSALVRKDLPTALATPACTGERPHKCPQCPIAYARVRDFTAHVHWHTGERPFTCSECPMAFMRKEKLKEHTMRNHTGERPYECSECQNTFVREDQLTTHMRVHTGEKPYKCLQCPMTFARKDALKKHMMQMHTGGQAFKRYSADSNF